jgi:hypothetical protein
LKRRKRENPTAQMTPHVGPPEAGDEHPDKPYQTWMDCRTDFSSSVSLKKYQNIGLISESDYFDSFIGTKKKVWYSLG